MSYPKFIPPANSMPGQSASTPFVVLFHEMPESTDSRGSHWDLMIATDDSGPLKTWALDQLPDLDAEDDFVVLGIALPDHRRVYLEYEGDVSGNRGTVRQIATGSATWLLSKDRTASIRLDTGDVVWHLTVQRESPAAVEFRFSRVG